jgi:cysteine synthase A
MNIAKDVTELVGKTPIVRLNYISDIYGVEILAKCEFMNPTSSVKDRIAKNMIQSAINRGEIDKETVVIEPTSGNTGIALASTCAAMGIELILTMPESMSKERMKLLKALGAKLVLTPANEGMQGSIDKAYELNKKLKNSIVLQQFSNQDNPKSHEQTTAQEILTDLKENLDVFIAAVGTGGTLSGTTKALKRKLKDLYVVAVEPKNSAVLSDKPAGIHKIQGIGAGFIPEILDKSIYDDVIQIDDDEAYETARMIAKKEGLLVGISSGANVCAAIKLAQEKKFKSKTILTILCDTAERYLSTDLFDD